MAPQTLDQSEGDKICGPDQTYKTHYEDRIVGLIKNISSQQVLHKLRSKSCRECWQHVPKLTWDVGEKGFLHCLTLAVKLP